MRFVYEYLFPAIWVAYLGYWWLLATKVKSTERREPWLSRWVRLLAIVAATLLLVLPSGWVPVLSARFASYPVLSFWIGALVTACGLLFSVWGRVHLGTNWSQAVTVKEGHELITSGPYSVVRHPIYTGLLTGFLGTAIARGEWRGLVAVLLVFAVLWWKLEQEERWMRDEFGDSYAAYSRRVAALVPFIL